MPTDGEYWVNRTCPGICPGCTSCLASCCRAGAYFTSCVAHAICMRILEAIIFALLIALVIYWAVSLPAASLRGARDWGAERFDRIVLG